MDHQFLRVAQHNIQSINNKQPPFLNENNVDICLLNETWLKSTSRPVRFPGYNFIHKNAKNEHGGVGILIRNNMKYSQLNTSFYEDIQCIAISLETHIGLISILCVYCPPDKRIRMNKLDNIIHNLPKPCIRYIRRF